MGLFLGNDLKYHKDVQHKNTGGVLATLKADHDWYLARIPESVKQALPETQVKSATK